MKINELLAEAEDNPFSAIKAMNAEFKQMAADVELTLVAGMGWPNINQKGGWFGGGLGSKGGNKKEADSLTLPVEIRRKAFLIALAKKLEGYLDEGRVVEIGRGSSRTAHSEKAIKGRILHQLTDNLVDAKPPGNVRRENMPCVVWFVGHDVSMANKTPLRISAAFYGNPPEGQKYALENLRVDVGGTIDTVEGRRLHSAFNKFQRGNGDWTEWDSKERKSISHIANKKWHAFTYEMGSILAKISGNKLPDTFDGSQRGYFNIDRKVLPSDTQRLTPQQQEQIISVMWKHLK